MFLVIVGVVVKVGMSLQDTPDDREEINTVVIQVISHDHTQSTPDMEDIG